MPFLYLSKTLRHPLKFRQMWQALDLLRAIKELENEGYLGHITYKEIGERLLRNGSPYVIWRRYKDKDPVPHPSKDLMWELTTLHFLRMRKIEFIKKGKEAWRTHMFLWALSHDPFRQPQLIRDSLEFYGKKTDPNRKKVKTNAAQHP